MKLRRNDLVTIVLLGLCVGCSQEYPTLHNKGAPGILTEDATRILPPEGVEIRQISSTGLGVTKVSEGWEPQLYNDPAGYCTIGYGHLLHKSPCTSGDPYQPGIAEEQGEELLRADMRQAEIAVTALVTVDLDIAQYSALCDFVFNVGSGNFKNSTLLREINTENLVVVPSELRRWRFANRVELPGLIVRREKEIEVWFDGQASRSLLPEDTERNQSPIDIIQGEV